VFGPRGNLGFAAAYHDEFQLSFQAKTFLAGDCGSQPSDAPELFDQMHVLNETAGRPAGIFPGTGVWMAPFRRPALSVSGTVDLQPADHGFRLRHRDASYRIARTGFFAGLLTAYRREWRCSATCSWPSADIAGFVLLFMDDGSLAANQWWGDALAAGIGLTWAMLCRPMTAAGFGLPFGIWTAIWLLRSPAPVRQRTAVFLGFAVPLGLGFAFNWRNNALITGSPWRTPTMYTDIYTPRHVFGFN